MHWSRHLLQRICGPMFLYSDDLLLLLNLFGQRKVLFLLLINHGQEQLFVHHHLLVVDHHFLVTHLWRRLKEDFIIAAHLRVDSVLSILLLLSIVRRLWSLFLALDKLDGDLFVCFNLLSGYDLRKRWLQL